MFPAVQGSTVGSASGNVGRADFVRAPLLTARPALANMYQSLVEDVLSVTRYNQMQVAETRLHWCGGGQPGTATGTKFPSAFHAACIAQGPSFSRSC